MASEVQNVLEVRGPFDPLPSARKGRVDKWLPAVCQVNEAATGSFRQLNGI